MIEISKLEIAWVEIIVNNVWMVIIKLEWEIVRGKEQYIWCKGLYSVLIKALVLILKWGDCRG